METIEKIIVIIVLVAVGGAFLYYEIHHPPKVQNFEPTITISAPLLQPSTTTGEANIQVSQPKPNDTIGKQLVVTGRARVFESQFSYRLLDASGKILAQGTAHANAPDAGQFGAFSITTSYKAPLTTLGSLEVFDLSPKDGTEIDKVIVPIKFK